MNFPRSRPEAKGSRLGLLWAVVGRSAGRAWGLACHVERRLRENGFHRTLIKALLGVALLVGLVSWTGLRGVPSESIPRGLYIQAPSTMSLPGLHRLPSGDVQRGNILFACPPDVPRVEVARERGYLHAGECSSGSTLVGKPVVGKPGDLVRHDSTGLWVNGTFIEGSQAPTEDSQGLPLLPLYGTFELESGQYYLYSPFIPKRSFDSRYFGPVEEGAYRAVPLLIEADIPPMPAIRDSIAEPNND